MTKKYAYGAFLAAALAVGGQAHGQLKNISATVLQSQTEAATSCTILATEGPTWRGLKGVVVLAEAADAWSDPALSIRLLENNEVMSNDTWTGNYYENGQVKAGLSPAIFSNLLRTPAGPRDAALLVSAPPGWRICATSQEVSSGTVLRRASVSITDVTVGVIALMGAAKNHSVSALKASREVNGQIGALARELAGD
ncbi:hypothetical protein [Ottowia testudinis]|uniref:Uncharacterized protein n=1 Tax=Ottowia testudinis TaxID=2816950 RepID=A0A975CJJ0_9BURK|nr:hypothetical protein [Ottowia testudinis]QTD46241.1 hypothetical protein J1M35_04895 [Ottowia testudinis]